MELLGVFIYVTYVTNRSSFDPLVLPASYRKVSEYFLSYGSSFHYTYVYVYNTIKYFCLGAFSGGVLDAVTIACDLVRFAKLWSF